MCKEDSVAPWRHADIAHMIGAMAHDTAAPDEAQRTLERKALRNVRSLVDKLEDEQHGASSLTWRFVAGSIVVALAAAVVVYFAMAGGKKQAAPIVSPVNAPTGSAPAR